MLLFRHEKGDAPLKVCTHKTCLFILRAWSYIKGLLKPRAKWANRQTLQYCEQSSSSSWMPGIWPIVCLSTPLYCLWSLPSVHPSLVYFSNSVNRGKQMANISSQKPGVSFWYFSNMTGITDANPLASTIVLCHQVSSLVKASLTLKSQSDLVWFCTNHVVYMVWTLSHFFNSLSRKKNLLGKKLLTLIFSCSSGHHKGMHVVKVTLCHPLHVMCRLGFFWEYRKKFRGQEGGFAVVPENAVIFLGVLVCKPAGLLTVQCGRCFPPISHFLITLNSNLWIMTISPEHTHNLSSGIGICSSEMLLLNRDTSTAPEQREIFWR